MPNTVVEVEATSPRSVSECAVTLRQERDEARDEMALLRSEKEEFDDGLKTQLTESMIEVDRLEKEVAYKTELINKQLGQIQEGDAKIETLETEYAMLKIQKDAGDTDLAECRAEFSGAQDEINQLKREVARLKVFEEKFEASPLTVLSPLPKLPVSSTHPPGSPVHRSPMPTTPLGTPPGAALRLAERRQAPPAFAPPPLPVPRPPTSGADPASVGEPSDGFQDLRSLSEASTGPAVLSSPSVSARPTTAPIPSPRAGVARLSASLITDPEETGGDSVC